MTGEAEFRYRYFARQGDGDLFGNVNTNPLITGGVGNLGFAGPVSNTVLDQGFAAKASDASISDNRVWLYPEFRINPAVRLRGEYWVTGTNLRGIYDGAGGVGATLPADNWTTPLGYTGWYIEQDGTNGNRTTPTGMSVGMWEKFWMTAQLPWGIFAVGRRPFPFGLGWSVAHERDADSESWFVGAPYGPFTFGMYLHTRVVGGDGFTENASALLPVPNINQAKGTDKNRPRNDFGPFFTYRNGPVELGMFQEWVLYPGQHVVAQGAGPNGADDNSTAALVGLWLASTDVTGTTPIYGDINFVIGINYFKYFNGRFFLNAEYNYEYADIPRSGGRPISMYADAWMGELGGICGPAKLSLAAFRSSGGDRRGGVANVTSPTGGAGSAANLGANVYDHTSNFLPFSGREQAMAPYVWLFGIYGGGNNGFDGRGKPNYADILAYAARLDYAVAANLNVSGSFIYMDRDSNTNTFIGQFRGGVPNTGVGTGIIRIHPGLTAAGAQAVPIPNVPDNYLGWEGDIGLNWKLLEGMTFNGLFAYWQPGDWFKWAYTDYGFSWNGYCRRSNHACEPEPWYRSYNRLPGQRSG